MRERRSSAKAAAARSNAPSAGSGASATGIGGTAARSFARRVALVVDAPAAASRKRDVFFFGAIYKNKKGERFFAIPDTARRASSQCLTLSGAPRPTSTTDIIIPSNQNQQQASLRAFGPHPKSGTRAMALPSVCPHQPSDATATSDCGSTCVHVCVAPVPDSVDDDVILPDRSERPTDQNARAACHYLGRSHAPPCHPRRRPLPLPAMPTDAACFASPDGLRSGRRSGLGWLFASRCWPLTTRRWPRPPAARRRLQSVLRHRMRGARRGARRGRPPRHNGARRRTGGRRYQRDHPTSAHTAPPV